MAIESGDATDNKDLLTKLRDFLTANDWVEESYTTTADDDDPNTLYLRGRGSTENEKVHVIIQTSSDNANFIQSWIVRCATGYDSRRSLELQPGVGPPVYFRCASIHPNLMNYWFYASDRRIIVVVFLSTGFAFAMYAGFFLAYANPVEYPFPLYVGATADRDEVITVENAGSRNFADPGSGAAYLRDTNGLWVDVWNHGRGNTSDNFIGANDDREYTIWPFNPGSNDVREGNRTPANWDLRPPPGVPNALPILPLQLAATRYRRPVIGMLENAFWVPGANLSMNNTFQLGSAVATGLLTLTGNASNGETITLGSSTGDPAFARFSAPSANFEDGDTVTIDGKTYTFQTTLTDADGNVLIGTDVDGSIANLIAAINLASGSGTTYAASTTVHPTVSAAAEGTRAIVVTAKTDGSAGNDIEVDTSALVAYWSDDELSGGRDPNIYTFRTSLSDSPSTTEVLIGANAAETRNNLAAAINGGDGRNVVYKNIRFLANPDRFLRAEVSGTQNLTVAAREFGARGNSIGTTETMANGSFGSATLTGGAGDESYRVFQNGNRVGRNHFFAVLEV